MTDIAHHHLAFGVIAIIGGHLYRTNYGIGSSMKEILEACLLYTSPSPRDS